MTNAELADSFHHASGAGDIETLKSILAPDVTFTGPLATTTGAEETAAGLVEMAKMIVSHDVAVRLADDQNVLLWSTIQTKVSPPTPTATWLQISDGKITAIRTVFDASSVSR